jgi:hypothetical protein
MCCSSKKQKDAAKYEKLYPKWERDDFNSDGTKATYQVEQETEVKKENDAILEAKFLLYCDKILEPAKDGSNQLDFDEFKEIYRVCLMWNKILNEGSNRIIVFRRRLALANKNMEEFKQICQTLKAVNEENLQHVTTDILKRIEMKEETYYAAQKDFSKDLEKLNELTEIEEQNAEVTIETSNDEYEPKVLGTHIKKLHAMKLHQRLHELSLGQLKSLKSKPSAVLKREIEYL